MGRSCRLPAPQRPKTGPAAGHCSDKISTLRSPSREKCTRSGTSPNTVQLRRQNAGTDSQFPKAGNWCQSRFCLTEQYWHLAAQSQLCGAGPLTGHPAGAQEAHQGVGLRTRGTAPQKVNGIGLAGCTPSGAREGISPTALRPALVSLRSARMHPATSAPRCWRWWRTCWSRASDSRRSRASLAGCPPCIEFLESLRRTIRLCRDCQSGEPPVPLSRGARQG